MKASSASNSDDNAVKTPSKLIHWARLYDMGSALPFGPMKANQKTIFELAKIEPGEIVMDIGCGPGRLAIAAKELLGSDGDVSGVDASSEMIDQARRNAAKMAVDVNFKTGLFEDIPLSDNTFNLVLSSMVLHHLPEAVKRQGFAELRRVLKPGGRFVAVDFRTFENGPVKAIVIAIGQRHILGAQTQILPAMMEEAGFKDIEAGVIKYREMAYVRGIAGS